MRRNIRSALVAASVVTLTAAVSAAWSYECETIPGGTCTCLGESDCTDMRHSTQCASSAHCSSSGVTMTCYCTASRANPGNGGTGDNSAVRRPQNEAPPPTSAKPPP
jgi:hypothetical protein